MRVRPGGLGRLTKHLLAAGFSLDELMKAGLSKEGRRARSTGSTAACCGRSGPRGRRRRLRRPPDLRRRPDRGQVPQHPRDARLPQDARAVRAGPGQARDRQVRQVVVVEGYTDVAAMHLAGVPTAVASCGTAFGTEHVSVIRRLIGDDAFDLGGDLHLRRRRRRAGRRAQGLRRRAGFATQTFVTIAPNGQDPCDLRLDAGTACATSWPGASRSTSSRSGRSCATTTSTPPRGGGGPAALRPARRPHQAGGAARDERAGSPAGRPGRRVRGRPAGPRERRARPPSGRVVRGRPRRPGPRRPAPAPAARGAQVRASGSRDRRPATTSCPRRRSRTPRTSRCTGRCRRRAECAAGGRVRRGWRP